MIKSFVKKPKCNNDNLESKEVIGPLIYIFKTHPLQMAGIAIIKKLSIHITPPNPW